MSSDIPPFLAYERAVHITQAIDAARIELRDNPSYFAAVRLQVLERQRRVYQSHFKPKLVTGKLDDPTQPPPFAE